MRKYSRNIRFIAHVEWFMVQVKEVKLLVAVDTPRQISIACKKLPVSYSLLIIKSLAQQPWSIILTEKICLINVNIFQLNSLVEEHPCTCWKFLLDSHEWFLMFPWPLAVPSETFWPKHLSAFSHSLVRALTVNYERGKKPTQQFTGALHKRI